MNSTIIISPLVSKGILDELKKLGITYVYGGKSNNIAGETAYHPDMLFYPLLNGEILTENAFVHNLDTIFQICEGKTILNNKYPQDCGFNCFTAGNNLIGGSHVADEIKEDAIKHKYSIISVKQGYAACSTVKLYNDAFISSDIGIYKTLVNLGFDALLVKNEGIALNGYNCGFIGGCELYSDKQMVAFSGDIKLHKDYESIKSFCANHGIYVYSLSKAPLYDYGGYITSRCNLIP